ncbi:hypothetical protein [Tenggerimyces flavus]|uniref:Uncharacterized protein n=1 Tax=Tenggerimyces flavus TaxID=1708749 RepID=A0ABV7YAT6_9ACTN|nr:hypothetical protein [Tenggerimyces flavus]MBM7788866.1 hypothetical protein [Tenggerimyces flavus]
MNAPARAEMDPLDCVHELTERIVHRERYTLEATSKRGRWRRTSRYHETEHPSLLEQLLGAVDPSRSAEEGTGIARPYGSAAAARLDAIDAALRIDREAAAWLRALGKDDPGDTIACVRQLGPHLRNTEIARDVRRWWTWARVLTGWDSPAWRPDNTCPLCGVRGILRVRLDKRSAVCIGCWETWDTETVGLLADHIRAENDAEKPTRAPLVAVYGTCPTCHTPNVLRQRQEGLGLQWAYACPHGHATV